MITTNINTGVNSLSGLKIPAYYMESAQRLACFASQMIERYAASVQRLMERGIYDGVAMEHHRAKLQQYKAIAAAPGLYVSETKLKGRAAHTAKRIINAMIEDTDASMCHTFAALTDGAKAIALQAGYYSNTYIRGNANGMDATAAAQELEAKAAANVSRKLREIDHTAAVAFLAEYIRRQRNEVAKETTPTTPETETPMTTTNNVTPAYEETHAARCLHIYLNNTSEIYSRYTLPAIERVTRAYKAGEMVSTDPEQLAKDVHEITPALQAAARLVRKHDHMTPTPADIEFVKADYVAYIIECAQYETTNA